MVKWTYLPAKNLLLPIIGLMASWSSHNYHKIIFSLIYIPIWISKRNISIFLQIKRPRTNKNWQADLNIFSAADRRGNEGFCGVDVILGPNNQKYLVMWKFRFKHIIHGIFLLKEFEKANCGFLDDQLMKMIERWIFLYKILCRSWAHREWPLVIVAQKLRQLLQIIIKLRTNFWIVLCIIFLIHDLPKTLIYFDSRSLDRKSNINTRK